MCGSVEVEVGLVEGMYNRTRIRVLVGPMVSEEFSMNIDLRQRSYFGPLMFIMLIAMVSSRVKMKGVLRRIFMQTIWMLWWRASRRCWSCWGSGRRHLGSVD